LLACHIRDEYYRYYVIIKNSAGCSPVRVTDFSGGNPVREKPARYPLCVFTRKMEYPFISGFTSQVWLSSITFGKAKKEKAVNYEKEDPVLDGNPPWSGEYFHWDRQRDFRAP
jgi:hypothetical protein